MSKANGGRRRLRDSFESRLRAVLLVVEEGLSAAVVAAGQCVARATLYRWLQRYRAGGEAGLRECGAPLCVSPRMGGEGK